jgi:hypothetical protein
MKILKSIGLYFVYPLVIFSFGFFAHMGLVNYFYPNRYANKTQVQEQEAEVLETDMVTEDAGENALEASAGGSQITTCDTKYVVIEYNLEDGSQSTINGKLPDKYLGMTRDKLEQALAEYALSPTLEDQEKGFISLQLEGFSQAQVTLQKNYRPVEKTTGYYLMVQDGKIVVLEEDMQTVYLTTDIYVEALSDALKQELILGKFINNMDELYGFLESYTS